MPLTFLLPHRSCAHFTDLLPPDPGPVPLQPWQVPRKAGQRTKGGVGSSRGLPVGRPHTFLTAGGTQSGVLDFYSDGPQLCLGLYFPICEMGRERISVLHTPGCLHSPAPPLPLGVSLDTGSFPPSAEILVLREYK